MFALDHLPVPHLETSLPGPKAREWLEIDHQFVSESYTRVYPLVVARGSGAIVEDVDGNRFLDFTAGIAVNATGHCHPHVVAAIQDQSTKLLHMSGTDFYYGPQIELAEKLAQLAPGPSPKKVFFTNSGAESIEAALKLARWHTRRNRVVAFLGAFHGRTYGAMSLSASKLIHRAGFSPLVPDIHHVPFPRDCDNCASHKNRTLSACECLNEIENHLLHRIAPPEEVAAIFVEAIQGEGGYHVAPPGFLQGLRKLCDKHGILLVMDEVQTGMGRTGKMFAVEHFGVEPDIICLAKGIASGLPLGAIIAKSSVMNWPSGSHASTFGGNPVSCRAALATIELLELEYMANAAERGEQLRKGLRDLSLHHECLANVRGLGLMTAVDLVKDQPNWDYHPPLRDAVIQAAFHQGLLLLGCGESAIRFCPPLCITAEQIDLGLSILEDVLYDVEVAPLPRHQLEVVNVD
ncbi:acetyl ornithine aminotransferase family protein [Telmatocola sphagniphila]|uniref:Acetyl ornithine aminotransferase family protein n=1 Tax=Telmatocola sphagniphila TaxID=1123043 RepID=A0A8E6B6X1_9BACT|nr:acetyl ornithine aminotransferase family protein [Telmatocola sphagniphila]QVL33012.1 acetyl ornithine aminotransferase family protein [Telmatocola sphagniphila]